MNELSVLSDAGRFRVFGDFPDALRLSLSFDGGVRFFCPRGSLVPPIAEWQVCAFLRSGAYRE